MKKLTKMLAGVLLGVLLISNTVSAEPSKPTDKHIYTESKAQDIRKIHNKAVKKDLITLNADGTIVINANATDLNVDEKDFEEYLKNIETTNLLVKQGVGTFDRNFIFQPVATKEITKKVYEYNKKICQFNLNN